VVLFGGAFYVTGGHIGHIETIKRLAHRAAPPVAAEPSAPTPTSAPAAAAVQPAAPPAAPKPVDTSSDKPVGTSSDKPVGTAPDKALETASEKLAGTTPDKPAGTAPDTPAGATPDKPVGSAPDKPAEPADPTVAGLRLEIQPREACWVSATADGQRVIYRMLNAGERMQVDAKDAVDLRVGDPSVIALTINGAAGRVHGTAGEAVSIHLTPQNYREFLSP
jgi:cytoskeletal protein RodZ